MNKGVKVLHVMGWLALVYAAASVESEVCNLNQGACIGVIGAAVIFSTMKFTRWYYYD